MHDFIYLHSWKSISISTKVQLCRAYIQPILLHGSETWALTRTLEDRITAFDNICLRRILRIPYTNHATNADVRLRAGSPPQLLPLMAFPFLRACSKDGRHAQDTYRALHTSARGLPKDWKRRSGRHCDPTRLCHVKPGSAP